MVRRRAAIVVLPALLAVQLLAAVERGEAAPRVGLIKGSGSAVYYYAEDGKRYIFFNSRVYFTWYSDFSTIQKISDSELATFLPGGNVTYRPGVKMVKLQTNPKVYAVDSRQTLRWVTSEDVATALYGPSWYTQVDDIPDTAFADYREGAPITSAADFNPTAVRAGATSISADRGLVVQEFTIEADDAGFYPSSATVERGQPVRLTFVVRPVGVYFAGLDFRSALFPSTQAGLGQSVTVKFPAPTEPTQFSSYWPSSGVLKATGTINVR